MNAGHSTSEANPQGSATEPGHELVNRLMFAGLILTALGQFMLEFHLLIGLVPLLIALVLWSRQTLPQSFRVWPTALVISAGCVLVIVLHFWQLGRFPSGLFFDEAVNVREGLDLTSPFRVEIWSYALSGRPTLFLYLVGIVQRLFSDHWMAARYFVIFVSLGSVAVMVWAIRPLVERATAIVSALIFGISAYHLLFSRMIYEATLSTIIFLIAVGSVIRATRTAGFRWWVVWGLSLGVGLWTYNAFRLVPIFFVIALFAWARSSGFGLIRMAVRITLGAVIALVVVSPLIPVVANNFADFTFRATELSVFNEAREARSLRPVIHNIATYGLMFFANPQTSNQMYQTPAFAPPAAILLWVGIGLAIGAVLRRDDGVSLALLFWLVAGLIPGLLTLSIEAPHWCRTLYSFPAAALLAAMGLQRVAGLAGTKHQNLVASCVLAVVFIGEIWAFDSRIVNDRNHFEFFYPRPSQAAMLARQRAAEGFTVLASDEFATEAYQEYVFWTIVGPDDTNISAIQIWHNLPRPHNLRPTSVLISSRDIHLADFLLRLYPGSALEITPAPWNMPLNHEVTIPAISTAHIGRSAGLMIRTSGQYRFSGANGFGLRLQGHEVYEGDIFQIPAGIWRVECDRPCSQTNLELVGPEQFLFRNALFNDQWAGHGLTATYRNTDDSLHRQLDRVVFANQRGILQPTFSVSWGGVLTVPEDGSYVFRLVCDDHAQVVLDDKRILHYPMQEGFHEQLSAIDLETGTHDLQIEFARRRGGLELGLEWMPPGAPEFERISLEFLTPESGPQKVEAITSPF